jgi:protein AaeX
MIKEISIGGVLFAPLLGYALAAALIWYALRYLLMRSGAYRFVWHPPLFNAGLYIILLSILVVATL